MTLKSRNLKKLEYLLELKEMIRENRKNCIEKIGKERILDEKIDFGLISPYKAQIQYIRSLIKKDGYFKPFRKLITVHTVDGDRKSVV